MGDRQSVLVVAIARMENDYVNEWVGHHLGIGVNHIVIYDNSSSDEEKILSAIYERYLDRVTVIQAYDRKMYQIPAYMDAYSRFGDEYDWIAYIDLDEFIMLQKDSDIHGFLDRIPADCECYRMNWQIYGDNGIINRNTCSEVIADFKSPDTKPAGTTKSIVRGHLKDIGFVSVHHPNRIIDGEIKNLITYYGDMKNITDELPETGKSINIGHCDRSLVKLNHYITKSITEFISQKLRRPDAAREYNKNVENDFFRYNRKTDDKLNVIGLAKREITYAYWSPKPKNNFENAGDYFNRILMEKLYFCKTRCVSAKNSDVDVMMCGSIITHFKRVSYVVGAGFQNRKPVLNRDPGSYLAVRGKMTAERLGSQGVNVGNMIKYVDPGLMVSMIYGFGEVSKKHKIGIIPHYVDECRIREKYSGEYEIISMKTTDVQTLCRKICECEIILSSSLHGIIFAHSFGIPAYHIELSKMMDGDNFKFRDYWSSFDGLRYENFKCDDYEIPFDTVLEFDSLNRKECNPDLNDIVVKQRDFLSVLPYKECLNRKFLAVDPKHESMVRQRENVRKVKRLRDDIRNGSICRLYENGNVIWKRI